MSFIKAVPSFVVWKLWIYLSVQKFITLLLSWFKLFLALLLFMLPCSCICFFFLSSLSIINLNTCSFVLVTFLFFHFYFIRFSIFILLIYTSFFLLFYIISYFSSHNSFTSLRSSSLVTRLNSFLRTATLSVRIWHLQPIIFLRGLCCVMASFQGTAGKGFFIAQVQTGTSDPPVTGPNVITSFSCHCSLYEINDEMNYSALRRFTTQLCSLMLSRPREQSHGMKESDNGTSKCAFTIFFGSNKFHIIVH